LFGASKEQQQIFIVNLISNDQVPYDSKNYDNDEPYYLAKDNVTEWDRHQKKC